MAGHPFLPPQPSRWIGWGAVKAKTWFPSLAKHPQHPSIWAISSDGIPQILTHAHTHTHTYTHPRTNSGWHVHFKWSEMRPILLLNFPLFSLITVTHTAGVAMAGACLDGSSITRKRHIDKTLALPPYLCSYASPNGGER